MDCLPGPVHQSLAREAWIKESGQLPLELDTQRGRFAFSCVGCDLGGSLERKGTV